MAERRLHRPKPLVPLCAGIAVRAANPFGADKTRFALRMTLDDVSLRKCNQRRLMKGW